MTIEKLEAWIKQLFAPGRASTVDLRNLAEGAVDKARAEECARCAALVRAAGCLCELVGEAMAPGFHARWEQVGEEDWVLIEHDPRCPEALALAIEAPPINPAE
jgi:hypothetical protein